MNLEKGLVMRVVKNADFAKTMWELYRQYGLGQFANWLTMKYDAIHREEVVQALQFPEVREKAANLITYYQLRIQEIESMLEDSKITEDL